MPSSIVDVESFFETKRKLLRFEYDLYKTIAYWRCNSNSYKNLPSIIYFLRNVICA